MSVNGDGRVFDDIVDQAAGDGDGVELRSTRILATSTQWETKFSPESRFWPRCALAEPIGAREQLPVEPLRKRLPRVPAGNDVLFYGAAVKQSRLREAHVASSSDNNVVLHGYVEYPARLHELFCYYPVVGRRCRIAARMIVNENDRRRPLRDRFTKYFARMHERRIEQSARYRDVALQPVLRVEDRDVKLLDRKVLQPLARRSRRRRAANAPAPLPASPPPPFVCPAPARRGYQPHEPFPRR